jgi:hypothetical protein
MSPSLAGYGVIIHPFFYDIVPILSGEKKLVFIDQN